MQRDNTAGMLAGDGRCKTLDASADGYSRAEAVGTIFLRAFSTMDSLSAPDAAGHALILGAAVNQDGRSSSLTAPNGPAQQALIRTALASAHLPSGKVRVGLLTPLAMSKTPDLLSSQLT